jgi:hypothetical protein
LAQIRFDAVYFCFWKKTVRFAAIAFAVLPTLVAATMPSRAEVPNAVAAVLGPSVGYLLAQSDLCEWGLTAKIEKAYQDGFKTIGMTAEQQATAWSQAAARHKALTDLPAEAKTHMKAETCTPASREQLEKNLAN